MLYHSHVCRLQRLSNGSADSLQQIRADLLQFSSRHLSSKVNIFMQPFNLKEIHKQDNKTTV